MNLTTSSMDLFRKSTKADPSLLSLTDIINDTVESAVLTYSSSKIEELIADISSGAILLATDYNEAATEGILICSQYDPDA